MVRDGHELSGGQCLTNVNLLNIINVYSINLKGYEYKDTHINLKEIDWFMKVSSLGKDEWRLIMEERKGHTNFDICLIYKINMYIKSKWTNYEHNEISNENQLIAIGVRGIASLPMTLTVYSSPFCTV